MAKKSSSIGDFQNIIADLKKKVFKPVYLLMGEETYYIDKIDECVCDNVLREEEKDFNQTIIYCTKDTKVESVINAARRYPMMSEYQTIIVREAQNLQKIDELAVYLEKPMKSTVLVIAYKHGTIDARKKLVPLAEKIGVVFRSDKLNDNQLANFVRGYVKNKNLAVEDKAVSMMVDSIGADLSRMASELDKLVLALPQGRNMILPDDVETNIGISKEFNNFELRNAIVTKDIAKANLIVNYFDKNPKDNPPIVTVAMLYSFFSNLMVYHYAPNKTEAGLMEQLGLKSPWALRDYNTAAPKYSARKTMNIISKIRETDAKLKGFQTGNATPGELLQELIFFILH